MESEEWDKVAEQGKYFHEIMSPFSNEFSKKQLFAIVSKFCDKEKDVIDLGAGLGFFIPFLSENFKSVTAIDFSEKMVEQAAKLNSNNVKVEQADLRDLSKYADKFDIAVAVNSILLPSRKDLSKILIEVYNVLKENGMFIGVFPSMNSEIYIALLVQEREIEKSDDEKKAMTNAARILRKSDYDFWAGTFEYQGKQKFFYDFELFHRFKKAGFKEVKIKKLKYPWEDWGDPDTMFLDEAKPWDWIVIAKKLPPKANGDSNKEVVKPQAPA